MPDRFDKAVNVLLLFGGKKPALDMFVIIEIGM